MTAAPMIGETKKRRKLSPPPSRMMTPWTTSAMANASSAKPTMRLGETRDTGRGASSVIVGGPGVGALEEGADEVDLAGVVDIVLDQVGDEPAGLELLTPRCFAHDRKAAVVERLD